MLQHAGTGVLAGDFLGGAAPVDVDEVGLAAFGHAGRAAEAFGVVAENLDAEGMLVRCGEQFAPDGLHLPDQRVGGDELADGDIRPHAVAEGAERRVGHIVHRGEVEGGAVECVGSKLHVN